MSSIDKYITEVGHSFGANVRYETKNGVITGYIGNTKIFSFPDRIGYRLEQNEIAAIREGINSYRVAEELRKARELEEKLKRERLEQERKDSIRELRTAVSQKRAEIKREETRRESELRGVQSATAHRNAALRELKSLSSLLDFSEIERESNALASRQAAGAELNISKCQDVLERVDALQARINDGLPTEISRALMQECRQIGSPSISSDASSYETTKLQKRISDMKQQTQELLPAIRSLERLQNQPGEVGIIATEALRSIKQRKITDTSDIKELAQLTEGRLLRIQEVMEASAMRSDVAQMQSLLGAIAACQKTSELSVESTYTAKDFRSEVEQCAERAMSMCRRLEQAEFTTCSAERRNQISQRVESVLMGDQSSSDDVEEMELLLSELVGYEESDRLHRAEFLEHKEMCRQLAEYGVDVNTLEPYDANRYTEQKRELAARMAYEIREAEKTRLVILDMQARVVMENMGFEELYTIGDSEGYVRETIYCKKGYEGVVWQVIVGADGSVCRRVIGINENGMHETSPEYVLEVAREMEEQHDPERFLQEFSQQVGEPLHVVGAIEHNSENALEAVEENGYFYMNEEGLHLYKERVQAAEKTRKAATAAPKQVCVPGKAVQNTSRQLVEKRQQLMQRSL